METIVVVLMILVCFNFMMKQTFRKRGSVAAIAVVAALFVGLMCHMQFSSLRHRLLIGWQMSN